MNNRPIRTNHDMDYETFKSRLQDKIQSYVSRPINFMDTVSTRINETLEGMALKLDGENTAPLIYPKELYEAYRAGIPLSTIAADAADVVKKTCEYPAVPAFTPENARKHIRFALINKDWNRELLETCPYKEVLDLAAIPKWYMDEGSFLIDNGILSMLQMTAEEVLSIAQSNTESEQYVCKSIYTIIRDYFLAEGVKETELPDAPSLDGELPLYVLTSQTGVDGSRAVLSDQFMQTVAHRLGLDELYLLPSSRDEMLAIGTATADDIAGLKDIVMQVNRDPRSVQPKNVLSDSVYFYNAKTHSLSVCHATPL